MKRLTGFLASLALGAGAIGLWVMLLMTKGLATLTHGSLVLIEPSEIQYVITTLVMLAGVPLFAIGVAGLAEELIFNRIFRH